MNEIPAYAGMTLCTFMKSFYYINALLNRGWIRSQFFLSEQGVDIVLVGQIVVLDILWQFLNIGMDGIKR